MKKATLLFLSWICLNGMTVSAEAQIQLQQSINTSLIQKKIPTPTIKLPEGCNSQVLIDILKGRCWRDAHCMVEAAPAGYPVDYSRYAGNCVREDAQWSWATARWLEWGMTGDDTGLSVAEIQTLICSGKLQLNQEAANACKTSMQAATCEGSVASFPDSCRNVLSGPTSPLDIGCTHVAVSCDCDGDRGSDVTMNILQFFSVPADSTSFCPSMNQIRSAFDTPSVTAFACGDQSCAASVGSCKDLCVPINPANGDSRSSLPQIRLPLNTYPINIFQAK